jgi:hypothetical protein
MAQDRWAQSRRLLTRGRLSALGGTLPAPAATAAAPGAPGAGAWRRLATCVCVADELHDQRAGSEVPEASEVPLRCLPLRCGLRVFKDPQPASAGSYRREARS